MSEVKRYNCMGGTDWKGDTHPFVAYSDYAALEQRLQAAERERDSAYESLEAQERKFADCPHNHNETLCACSYDRTGDICGHHSPQLKEALRERDVAMRALRRIVASRSKNISPTRQ